MIVTADHGMTAIDPAATMYVNQLWPELSDHLERGSDGKVLAPGGSAATFSCTSNLTLRRRRYAAGAADR